MPKDFARHQRVEGQLQRELVQLLRQEIKDPRLGMVTISAVEVSRDLSQAKIYITVMNEADQQPTLEILQGAAGHLRQLLGRSLRMRMVPRLHFIYDHSIERGMQLESLIQSAVKSDRKPSGDND